MTKSWETKRDEIESQLEIAERDFKIPEMIQYYKGKLEGFDAGHARAQDRIDEKNKTIEEYQRKNLLICDMLDKERVVSANLQAKLEACEAELHTLEIRTNLIDEERNRLDEQNKKLLNEIHQGEHLYIQLADVKPLVEALNVSRKELKGTRLEIVDEALQAFREKHKGVV